MKRISRKFGAAFKVLGKYGLSGVTVHLLEAIVSSLYVLSDRRRKQQPPSLSLSELGAHLRGLGIGAGSTLLVHSSWDALKGSDFKPFELIEFLKKLVGPSGTIAMPSYTNLAMEDGVCFDVDRATSNAGWITEVFRRMPGVLRSANVSHPVCALGPEASFLVDEHHLGSTPWDEYSPYFRAGAIHDSWIVGIGVGHGLRVTTSLHCAESVLSNHPYFQRLFTKEISYTYLSKRYGSGVGRVKIGSSVIVPKKIYRFFDGILYEEHVAGVEVSAIRGRELIEKAIEIGLKGKVMHIWPIPWPWLFDINRRSVK